MVYMTFNDIGYLSAGLTKYKRDKEGNAFLSATHWQKNCDASLFIYLYPHKNGTWYCSYDLTLYRHELKNQKGARICHFDEDLRKFVKEMRSLKAIYIDK